MNYRMVVRTLGHVLVTEGLMMALPLLVALWYHEQGCVLSFAAAILLVLLVGVLFLRVRTRTKVIYAREGFLIVSLAWILVSFFGAVPFFISGSIPDFIDCVFETVSGFTTTGSSILADVEALPQSMLFWRSFTHWVGGMGVLVFVMAVLPMSNEHSMHVMRAEVPGPVVGKLVSKTRSTAMILYSIYMTLTVLQVVLLLCGGLPFFDSLVTAFGTAGTGGFGIKNASIGFYNSAYIDGVVTVFMLLFGVNFNLYFLLLMKDWKHAFKNEELWAYVGIVGASMMMITLNILPLVGRFTHAFRLASFQVSSIMTTTGFATADFNAWPTFSKTILFLLMIIGASAGSTGGGIKVSRLLIIVKKLRNGVIRLVHPRSVTTITLDGKAVSKETANEVSMFFAAYIFLMGGIVLLVSLDGFDFETTVTSVAACIGNIGPGLGLVGPTGNFEAFSWFSKLLLSFAMLLGRLEIFPLLLSIAPLLYRKK